MRKIQFDVVNLFLKPVTLNIISVFCQGGTPDGKFQIISNSKCKVPTLPTLFLIIKS